MQWAAGLIVTTTCMSQHEKQAVRRHVEEAGGRYSPNLSQRTTHLVTPAIISSLSDKLSAAAAKHRYIGLHVVSSNWVVTSLRMGTKASEVAFPPAGLKAKASPSAVTPALDQPRQQQPRSALSCTGGRSTINMQPHNVSIPGSIGDTSTADTAASQIPWVVHFSQMCDSIYGVQEPSSPTRPQQLAQQLQLQLHTIAEHASLSPSPSPPLVQFADRLSSINRSGKASPGGHAAEQAAAHVSLLEQQQFCEQDQPQHTATPNDRASDLSPCLAAHRPSPICLTGTTCEPAAAQVVALSDTVERTASTSAIQFSEALRSSTLAAVTATAKAVPAVAAATPAPLEQLTALEQQQHIWQPGTLSISCPGSVQHSPIGSGSGTLDLVGIARTGQAAVTAARGGLQHQQGQQHQYLLQGWPGSRALQRLSTQGYSSHHLPQPEQQLQQHQQAIDQQQTSYHAKALGALLARNSSGSVQQLPAANSQHGGSVDSSRNGTSSGSAGTVQELLQSLRRVTADATSMSIGQHAPGTALSQAHDQQDQQHWAVTGNIAGAAAAAEAVSAVADAAGNGGSVDQLIQALCRATGDSRRSTAEDIPKPIHPGNYTLIPQQPEATAQRHQQHQQSMAGQHSGQPCSSTAGSGGAKDLLRVLRRATADRQTTVDDWANSPATNTQNAAPQQPAQMQQLQVPHSSHYGSSDSSGSVHDQLVELRRVTDNSRMFTGKSLLQPDEHETDSVFPQQLGVVQQEQQQFLQKGALQQHMLPAMHNSHPGTTADISGGVSELLRALRQATGDSRATTADSVPETSVLHPPSAGPQRVLLVQDSSHPSSSNRSDSVNELLVALRRATGDSRRAAVDAIAEAVCIPSGSSRTDLNANLGTQQRQKQKWQQQQQQQQQGHHLQIRHHLQAQGVAGPAASADGNVSISDGLIKALCTTDSNRQANYKDRVIPAKAARAAADATYATSAVQLAVAGGYGQPEQLGVTVGVVDSTSDVAELVSQLRRVADDSSRSTAEPAVAAFGPTASLVPSAATSAPGDFQGRAAGMQQHKKASNVGSTIDCDSHYRIEQFLGALNKGARTITNASTAVVAAAAGATAPPTPLNNAAGQTSIAHDAACQQCDVALAGSVFGSSGNIDGLLAALRRATVDSHILEAGAAAAHTLAESTAAPILCRTLTEAWGAVQQPSRNTPGATASSMVQHNGQPWPHNTFNKLRLDSVEDSTPAGSYSTQKVVSTLQQSSEGSSSHGSSGPIPLQPKQAALAATTNVNERHQVQLAKPLLPLPTNSVIAVAGLPAVSAGECSGSIPIQPIVMQPAGASVTSVHAQHHAEPVTAIQAASTALGLWLQSVTVVFDPSLPADEQQALQQALGNVGGSVITGSPHLGCGANMVVALPERAGKWLQLLLNVMSPAWLLKACQQVQLQQGLQLQAAQAGRATVTVSSDIAKHLGQVAQQNSALFSTAGPMQQQQPLSYAGSTTGSRSSGGGCIATGLPVLHCPPGLLADVVPQLDEAQQDASPCGGQSSMNTSHIIQQHMLPRSLLTDLEWSVDQHPSKLPAEGTEAVVLQGGPAALTLLLPQDSGRVLGHAVVQCIPADAAKGYTCGDLLLAMHAFYQETVLVRQGNDAMVTGRTLVGASKTCGQGMVVQRVKLLGARLLLEGLVSAANGPCTGVYEVCLT